MIGPNGKREELQKIEATEARETLGVWQAANGQEKTQVEKLKEKVQDWGNKINSSHINPQRNNHHSHSHYWENNKIPTGRHCNR